MLFLCVYVVFFLCVIPIVIQIEPKFLGWRKIVGSVFALYGFSFFFLYPGMRTFFVFGKVVTRGSAVDPGIYS